MSLQVTLPEYVEQNHDRLLKSAIMGAESAKMFTLQTGVKTESALNLLNTEVIFQDGSACGFNAQGSTKITQRTISAPIVKVNMEFCDKDLLKTCLQHNVRVAAGQKTLPFEQDFIEDVVKNVNLACEKMVWQGDTAKSEDNVLKWTDGLLKHLTNADNTIKMTHYNIQPDEPVVKKVDAVVMKIPTAILKNAVIFMGYEYFRSYMMEMKDLNLFHYNADGIETGEVMYPGSTIKIKAVSGLDGTGAIVAADPSNLYYGTDLQDDQEKFDFWYSRDNGVFRLAIEFGLGTQVAFPNEVVLSTETQKV